MWIFVVFTVEALQTVKKSTKHNNLSSICRKKHPRLLSKKTGGIM